MNIETRPENVEKWRVDTEDNLRRRIENSASRFGKLVRLRAPNFIVEFELIILAERVEALRLMLGYDVAEELAKHEIMAAKGGD